ncbi:LPXTG-site transpeptidase (sortase) family protein [Conyzicola lurida]|uniref:LPXTG-site transpeptidase (Sortase) family protein n=1 Tax=Conyzicola lurida TaxID=1172621 RepID=A0A841AJP7_9MICO|nr:class F sortase [Conyzicola lurida]MBB5844130.1 LPXTG-site transpeptidase (sortase) family protein [Conyzicola lurida]
MTDAARSPGTPGWARCVALAAGMLLLAGCAAVPPPEPAPTAPAETSSPTATPAPVSPRPVGVEPASVAIDRMGLTESLIPLGLQADGTMEVPTDFSRVGWFTGGGKPGTYGPTVIAGHVDSLTGPAVFSRLSELQIGDRVLVTGVDGSPHEYAIDRIENYKKSQFPTAVVFGATLDDELRLVTCGGLFDREVGHYEDNLVVFATRV